MMRLVSRLVPCEQGSEVVLDLPAEVVSYSVLRRNTTHVEVLTLSWEPIPEFVEDEPEVAVDPG